jgi:hypothetical protein
MVARRKVSGALFRLGVFKDSVQLKFQRLQYNTLHFTSFKLPWILHQYLCHIDGLWVCVEFKSHNIITQQYFQFNDMLYWLFQIDTKSQSIVYLLNGSEHIYILNLGPWRRSALNMGFVDKRPSRMQGQWFFWSRAGGRATISSWVQKIKIFWTGGCPCPNIPPPKKFAGGGELNVPHFDLAGSLGTYLRSTYGQFIFSKTVICLRELLLHPFQETSFSCYRFFYSNNISIFLHLSFSPWLRQCNAEKINKV